MKQANYTLTENEICQAIAQYLVDNKGAILEHGTLYFEKTDDGHYDITVYNSNEELNFRPQ